MKTLAKTISLSALMLLISAQAAFAGNNGQGLYGEADDKVVTFFGLGLVILFPLITIIGSVIQGRLERRKDERTAALHRAKSH